jgi:hypothetical protein
MVNTGQFFHFPSIKKWLAVFWCLFFLLVSPLFAEQVEATLDRDSVPSGNGAILTVKVSGSDAGKPEMPEIENFIIRPQGTGQQIQIINGKTTRSLTFTYVVGSNVAGDYEIPPIGAVVNGKKLFTPPLKLKVLDASAGQPPVGMPAPGSAAGGAEADTGEDGRRFGFLTVELADKKRKHVYVGEIAPVRIRAWLPAESRAQLRSGIQPEGKAFTLHNVSGQPQQTEEVKDGKRYLVVTWYGGMSATKAGNHPASLSLSATVAVRDRSAPAPRRRMGGPFGDPFFDDIFDNMNARMIEKDVTLKSDDQPIEVRALPSEGKPEGFTGAVGDFQFDGMEVPREWTTGEPQEMAARIKGSGNFALMKAPVVAPAVDWKVYPGKDAFTPGDEASFAGSKTFRFSAVPRKGGDQQVSLAFSYFNPEAGVYQTLASPPQAIRVAGKNMIEIESEVAAGEPEPEKKVDRLVERKNHYTAVPSLVPMVSRPQFAPMLACAGLLALVGRWILWVRLRRNDPSRLAARQVEKATREALAEAERCAENQEVAGFFIAARQAMQQRLGLRWNQPCQAITLAEVSSRLPGDSAVVRLFREVDRQEYSHQAVEGMKPEWRVLLDEAMNELTGK